MPELKRLELEISVDGNAIKNFSELPIKNTSFKFLFQFY
jgi:hypothetical protein